MKRRMMGHSASTPPDQYQYPSQFPGLPLAAIEEVLLNVPAQQVLCVCRLVCREWKAVVDSVSFWKEKCRREGLRPRNADKSYRVWQVFYWLSKKRRNLLKNHKAEETFSGWDIKASGGDGWKIEGPFEPHPDETITQCFVTSYRPCIKEQLINLKKEGYSPALLDEIQPDILISDWYAPRWDCGSEYDICVKLLDHKKQTIRTFQPDRVTFPQWNDQQWNQVTHVFSKYGKGVRYVQFTHGGQDTQYWAGWYGIRVTNSSVEIFPKEEL